MTHEKLLFALHTSKDTYISGEELADRFSVSRTSVWNHIDYLRKQGYTIEAHPNLGYRLINVPDRLLPDEIQYELNTKVIGRKIYSFEEINSTNDTAWEKAIKGEPEGAVIFAEFQTKGRGRLKRQWFSPGRKGLLFSVILKPHLAPNYVPMITAMSAVSVARAITKYTGLSSWIKWPNDIFVNGKKAAGILTEINTELDVIKFVVLGIGVNANMDKFSDDIKKTATSLRLEGGMDYSRVELSKEILRSLEHYYNLLLEKKWDEIIVEWKNLSYVLGKRIKVVQGGKKIEGQAMGIDEQGALVVRHDDGVIDYVITGDVICC